MSLVFGWAALRPLTEDVGTGGALRQQPQAIALPLVSGRDFHTKSTPSSAKAVYRP